MFRRMIGGSMAKGFCSACKQEVGGLLKPKGLRCPACKKMFCEQCAMKKGLVVKKPYCPDCGVQLSG